MRNFLVNPATRVIVVAPMKEYSAICQVLRQRGNAVDEKRLIEGTADKVDTAFVDLQFIFDNLRVGFVVVSPRIPKELRAALDSFCEKSKIPLEVIDKKPLMSFFDFFTRTAVLQKEKVG